MFDRLHYGQSHSASPPGTKRSGLNDGMSSPGALRHSAPRNGRAEIYRALFSLFFILVTAVSCRSRADGGIARHEVSYAAQEVAYRSTEEKALIREINLVRTNPRAYANYLKQERVYYHDLLIKRPGKIPILTREGRAALEACIAILEEAEPVSAMLPDECLSRAAGLLAAEQAKGGAKGHTGANGQTLQDRILLSCGERVMRMAENISYGNSMEARAIVIRFLIDDGIPSRGHRITLMNPSYTHCGVAMASHPVYRQVCVIDFAAY